MQDIAKEKFTTDSVSEVLLKLRKNQHYKHLHNIDNAIFMASIDYFRKLGASWANLPLTTMMISSPGEVYAGKKLDYTTDALPVELSWFDNKNIFLAESSQFYLELRLLIENLEQVFSIYNSFRKELSDFSHLAEFQHIEYEGKNNIEESINVFLGLIKYITDYIIENNRKDLAYYLSEEEIDGLKVSFDPKNIHRITFKDAMSVLSENFSDKKYTEISLKNFGSLEEIALTRIFGKHCLVTDFPVEEIPFYHVGGTIDAEGREYAKNADLILLGYREVIGAGQRITDIDAIRQKADFFNLPREDYEPYVNMRQLEGYKTTSGFGFGWQRYTQWLLKMPFIWQMSHIPRTEHEPRP